MMQQFHLIKAVLLPPESLLFITIRRGTTIEIPSAIRFMDNNSYKVSKLTQFECWFSHFLQLQESTQFPHLLCCFVVMFSEESNQQRQVMMKKKYWAITQSGDTYFTALSQQLLGWLAVTNRRHYWTRIFHLTPKQSTNRVQRRGIWHENRSQSDPMIASRVTGARNVSRSQGAIARGTKFTVQLIQLNKLHLIMA